MLLSGISALLNVEGCGQAHMLFVQLGRDVGLELSQLHLRIAETERSAPSFWPATCAALAAETASMQAVTLCAFPAVSRLLLAQDMERLADVGLGGLGLRDFAEENAEGAGMGN